MFNPNARRQYEMDDYDERVECICTIVPIFDDFEQVYGNWFSSKNRYFKMDQMNQFDQMDHSDHLKWLNQNKGYWNRYNDLSGTRSVQLSFSIPSPLDWLSSQII